jgi:GNAT superfamily N-acetyltransferase
VRSGAIVAEFSVKDGQKVVFRTPRWEDLDELLELINSLVEDKAEIVISDKLTWKEEADWLADLLVRLEKDQAFFFVAEVDGRVVASCDLHVGKGTEVRAGNVGIVVKDGFRGVGIGTRMMWTIVKFARKRGLRVLVLSVFALMSVRFMFTRRWVLLGVDGFRRSISIKEGMWTRSLWLRV